MAESDRSPVVGAAGGDSAGGPAPSDKAPGAPRDRRVSHRAAIEIPALLHVGTREVACSVRDLSVRGIALAVNESIAPGMVVRVQFRLPNSRQPVEVAGVLVRTVGGRQGSTIGLEFVEPGADALRVIRTYVDRNRSDQPFSRRGAARPATRAGDKSEAGVPLAGLYKRAVSEVDAKGGKRRRLFDRWRRR